MVIMLSLSLTLNVFLFFGVIGGVIAVNKKDQQIKVLEYQRDQLK